MTTLPDISEFIGLWTHAVAAAAFAVLALWQAGKPRQQLAGRALSLALACTSVWAMTTSVSGPYSLASISLESVRNIAWLGFMYALLRQGGQQRPGQTVVALYLVVTAVAILSAGVMVAIDHYSGSPRVSDALFYTGVVLRMSVAIGALVLLHNLYIAAEPDARWGMLPPIAALAAMWTYDLNLYTLTYLTHTLSLMLFAFRGAIMAMLVPLLVLGSRRNRNLKFRLSRTVTFQSLSLVAIGFYLICMIVATRTIEFVGGSYAEVIQIAIISGMSLAALLLLPSGRARGWIRVKVAKHFFQHRYDYREEWLRFNHTLASPGDTDAPIDMRVIRAIADITDSPGGALLLPDESLRLRVAERWNWHTLFAEHAESAAGDDAALLRWVEQTGRVLEFDTPDPATSDEGDDGHGQQPALPAWLRETPEAWAGAPLIHGEKLLGIVVVMTPRAPRSLDWEDFDLLKIAGRQAASYLAEARGQEALSDARRFDEFNRRFAFIMHDIKNLTSQLGLVARNAERHHDNPEFRADMIATIRGSVDKMNDMLARLSQHHQGRADEPRPVSLRHLVVEILKPRQKIAAIKLGDMADAIVMVDPVRFEQALGHIVQNAIDASRPGDPVWVSSSSDGVTARIDVLDHGTGMTSEFVRSQLFKPFSSSKQGGFGIGAFEARSLIRAMHGRLAVESHVGQGSRFSIFLPLAQRGEDVEWPDREESPENNGKMVA